MNKYLTILPIMALLLTGCETLTSVTSDSGKSQTYEQQAAFPDMPIPQKTKIIPNESLILGRDKSMTGRITLDSEFSVEKVFLYYQQQMPTAGWKELTSLQGEVATIIFTKSDRVANITIRPKTGITSGARAEIFVSPNRGTASGGTTSLITN